MHTEQDMNEGFGSAYRGSNPCAGTSQNAASDEARTKIVRPRRKPGAGTVRVLSSGRFQPGVTLPDGKRVWLETFATREEAEDALAVGLVDSASMTLPEPIRPWPRAGGVYFATDHRRERVKIGHAKDNIHDRLLGGACWVPTIQLLAFIPNATKVDEARLHQDWRHIRFGGEWFDVTPELALFIRGVRLRNRG